MKKKYLLILSVIYVSNSFGQTNTFPTTGNVGIGTASPTHTLTVDGDIKLNNRGQGLLVSYASFSETKNAATTILGNNVKAGDANHTVRRFASNSDAGSYLALSYYYGITFHTGINSTLNTDVSERDSEVMRINHAGNVGIGTGFPSEKLSVKGKIRAQEIKVENANWPDFVFAKDYSLPTLQETEAHIKANGHLPGIPSAEKVKANGVDLGDMNAKLLQKIEELTLHLIEIKKEMEKRDNQHTKDIMLLKSKINKKK